jgi:hypothetical protein
MNGTNRPLYEIAREIRADWKNLSPYAKPYVEAMADLYDINDKYFFDSAKDIVNRFLCNASGWRGEVAKRVKAELKGMVK